MNKKVITIDKLNSGAFTSFVKKLLSIDKFVYLKFDNGHIISNVYLPEHDAIKQQIIPLANLFEMDELQLQDNVFKISFYNGNRVIDALKSFGLENIRAEVTFEKTDSGWIAINFLVTNINQTDKINLPCADPSINFMDLTQSQIESIYDDSGKMFKFTIDTDSVSKLESRFNLEKEVDTFMIVLKEGQVLFKSPNDTYNTLVENAREVNSEDDSVLVYKRYLGLFDGENYECSVCHNKLILKSNDSETLLSIATCRQD
jgi:hypothetical protein